MFVKYTLLTFFFLFGNTHLFAQLIESFSDGDFTTQPEWRSSQQSDWIINNNKQLQSNIRTENVSFWISTPNKRAIQTEWSMHVQLEFNPSSANYVDLFLTASEMNVSTSSTTGYFIRMGNSEDEISLYRKEPGNLLTKLIDGRNGFLNNSSNNIRLKVMRDEKGTWFLLVKKEGETDFSLEGSVSDTTYTTSSWFGILVKQSTVSFFQKHILDDLLIQELPPDQSPPVLLGCYYRSDSLLHLLFDEAILPTSSLQPIEFNMSNGIGQPLAVRTDQQEISLLLRGKMIPATPYQLTLPSIQDIRGNKSSPFTFSFTYHSPSTHDILITEIMADPSPPKGLPDAEWIELKNRSKRIIPLSNWRINDNGASSKPFKQYLLYPDSCLIITSRTAETAMQAFGKTMGVDDFPSLNNDTDILKLLNENGQQIHVVGYSSSWYRNALKQEGGWSLEMMDINHPCGGADNWLASMHPAGGTPGKTNSVVTVNADTEHPVLERAFAIDPLRIRLYFNEPVDSSSASIPTRYFIDGGVGKPVKAEPEAPFYSTVLLTVTMPLEATKIYSVEVQSIADCAGNTIGNFNRSSFGLTETCNKGDVIINEILFDPKGDGSDYIELFNRSQKRCNLKMMHVTTRNNAGFIGETSPFANEDHALEPGAYAVLCNNKTELLFAYPAHNKDVIFSSDQLPSFPNEKGTVVLLNDEGVVLDEAQYAKSWHFPLLKETEGVSLERIDPDADTQQKENWFSAAQDIGFGTPGLRNSQYRRSQQIQGMIQTSPSIFSPDQDGQDDFLTLQYAFEENGYVLNCKIFDAGGNMVRYLQRNLLCGRSGSFRWDGLNDQSQPLISGPYLLVTDVFHLSGKTKRFTNRIVLAKR